MDNYKKKYLKYKLKYLNLKKSSKVNNNFNKQSSKINYTLMKGGMTPAVDLEKKLNDYLKTCLNLKNKDVWGDGSCQFHAVIHQLKTYFPKKVDESGDPYTSDSLRKKVVEHMNTMANGTEEQKFKLNTAARFEWAGDNRFTDSKIKEMENKDGLVNSYIKAMKRSCEYGDLLTLEIISEILEINIILINLTVGGVVPLEFPPNKTYNDTITITLRAKHYQSAIKLERDEKLEHLKLKLKNMQFDYSDSDDNDQILSNLKGGFYDTYLYTLIDNDNLKNIDEAIKFFKVNVPDYLRLINKDPRMPALSSLSNDSLNYNLNEVHNKGFTAYYKEKMLRLIKLKTDKNADEGKLTLRPNKSEIKYVADNLENIDNVYDFLYYNQVLLQYLDASISYHDFVKEELKKCFEEANENFDTYKKTAQKKAKEIKTKVEYDKKLKEQSYRSTAPQSASLFESPVVSAPPPKETAPKEPAPPPASSVVPPVVPKETVPKEPASLFESPVVSASAPSLLFKSPAPPPASSVVPSVVPKETAPPPAPPPASSVVPPAPSPVVPPTSAPPPTSVPKSSFKSSNSKSDPYKLSQDVLDAIAVVGGGVSIVVLFILMSSIK